VIKVEVCYALADEQCLVSVLIPAGSSVIRAIMASGILEKFPDLALSNNIGIFSEKVPLHQVLKEGDRVEFYRLLAKTPNQLRLLRAK
jgi:uncharacterized protein